MLSQAFFVVLQPKLLILIPSLLCVWDGHGSVTYSVHTYVNCSVGQLW